MFYAGVMHPLTSLSAYSARDLTRHTAVSTSTNCCNVAYRPVGNPRWPHSTFALRPDERCQEHILDILRGIDILLACLARNVSHPAEWSSTRGNRGLGAVFGGEFTVSAHQCWPCVQGRGLALASIARTRAEAAFTMAHTAIAELGGSRQRTAQRRSVGRCPAMCSAWPTIRGRGMDGIDRPPTRFGINHASAWPSESPTCARTTNQRGLTPLIDPFDHAQRCFPVHEVTKPIRCIGC